ncbi:sigma-54-dependent Fis family transcriptional regulator [Pseudomonas sp. BGr12]|uniref:sigma-54-dependent Fis family transcriptional regulator n=1 Tax=Pseudomonas sp. BGr12 TaxID=2936269 RepID=UPI0025599EDF|nr:sigma-54-dependent Fis family transcriptional regulator [Pseudomonas sp. BJa5]MDL2428433.1 sigma-54-dependent Fis family transcriptional regulator [Pseudomonas sp. BJa5]
MATNLLPRDITQARRSFLDGEQIPVGLVPQPLLRSWERTVAAGIRPADRLLFGQSISKEEERRVEDEHRAVIDTASPDILSLWSSMQSPNWVVLFTNASGTILHTIGNQDVAPRELRLPLQCGRRLPESEMGTNAPAVVLSELEPAIVQRGEHFLDELSHFSCAAAPVFALDGSLAGVLDATGFDARLDPRALHRVSLAARSIENRFFEAAVSSGILLALHEDPRLIGTPFQGMILVREDGRLLTANRAAKQMLHIDLDFVQRGQVIQFDQLIDQNLYALLSLAGRGFPTPIHTRSGAKLFLNALRKPSATIGYVPAVNIPISVSGDITTNALMERAGRVFKRGIPVLLQGETGTGKEWFANKLHSSVRPGKPFIAVNCSAIAESLAESELFGYEDGAYTGSRKGGAPGKLELAQGGTLFLDEIGDMPLPLQTKLLRALQERSTVRLGGHREIKLDILVVSATHRDLPAMVKEGQFREDLYFRLNGYGIKLPALRERTDLNVLIDQMVSQFSDYGVGSEIPSEIKSCLLRYDWPGNIRQLRHVIEVACALVDDCGRFDVNSFPEEIRRLQGRAEAGAINSYVDANDTSLSAIKSEWVNKVLLEQNGNVSATAKALGVSRTTLYKYLNR